MVPFVPMVNGICKQLGKDDFHLPDALIGVSEGIHAAEDDRRGPVHFFKIADILKVHGIVQLKPQFFLDLVFP